MWKLNGPRETVERLLPIVCVILVVLDFISFSPPANVVGVGIQLGVHEWLHPYSIQALSLQQVDNGEAIGDIFSGVLNSKIKPLSVFIGVEVSSQGEFIFIGVSVMERIEEYLHNNLTLPSKINLGKHHITTVKPSISCLFSNLLTLTIIT